jgi:hypothetical protein
MSITFGPLYDLSKGRNLITPGGRRMGFKRDRFTKRPSASRLVRTIGSSTYPLQFCHDRTVVGLTFNQLTGSCVTHSGAKAQKVSIATKAKTGAGPTLNWADISPRQSYNQTLDLERGLATPVGQTLPPLADTGLYPNDYVHSLGLYGIDPIGKYAPCPSPDGSYTDSTPQNLVELTLEEEESMGMQLDPGAYDLSMAASEYEAETFRVTASGLGCCSYIFVDTAFENWDPASGPIRTIDLSDPAGGGHALFVEYYYRTAAGLWVVGFLNSWSDAWPAVPADDVVPNSPFYKPGRVEVLSTAVVTYGSQSIAFDTTLQEAA